MNDKDPAMEKALEEAIALEALLVDGRPKSKRLNALGDYNTIALILQERRTAARIEEAKFREKFKADCETAGLK